LFHHIEARISRLRSVSAEQRYWNQSIMTSFPVLALLSAVVVVVDAYSGGAPSSACSTMTPGHGSRPRTGEPPFSILVDAPGNVYRPQQHIAVNIRSTGRSQFKGFLLVAKTSDGDNVVGTFEAPQRTRDAFKLACDNQGVTHNSNHRRRSISFQWIAPPQPVGDVTFTATIVESYYSHVANVRSVTLKPSP
jgi:hypothetical protein